jgi:hypothetical protein
VRFQRALPVNEALQQGLPCATPLLNRHGSPIRSMHIFAFGSLGSNAIDVTRPDSGNGLCQNCTQRYCGSHNHQGWAAGQVFSMPPGQDSEPANARGSGFLAPVCATDCELSGAHQPESCPKVQRAFAARTLPWLTTISKSCKDQRDRKLRML